MMACSGNIDKEDDTNDGPTEPYTLSVSKDEIESDGKDEAVFTITDANGLVLTGPDYIRSTSFHIAETDVWQSGMVMERPNVLTSIKDGTYTVSAMYEGVKCANEVTVVSKNRSAYELFHKNVAIYRFTATWCQYCPALTTALSKLDDYTRDHSIVLEFHKDDEFSIAALTSYLNTIAGVPYCVYSLDSSATGASSAAEIGAYVEDQLVKYPAMTGIKASSSVSGNKLTVEAVVKASKADKFDLGMAILRDNCVPASSTANESVYNDVVISISGNYRAMSPDSSFSLKANEEKKVIKEWTNDFLTSAEAKNCRVVLFTLVSYGGKVVIDNAVEFKLGEGISEYRGN